MGYLDPPPMPAPVIVVKDVGGVVRDYQAQTELYRSTDREVRLHECRSACTMALSLPNVCVYPDSILKFHQAYNLRNHVTDADVSQQLFSSYPASVRARLGVLTRDYRILSGADLISLGIRNCNDPRPREPKILVASVRPQAIPAPGGNLSLSSLVRGVMSVFDPAGGAPASAPPPPRPEPAAKAAPADLGFAEAPLPPPRPAATSGLSDQPGEALPGVVADVPLPPHRPLSLAYAYTRPLPVVRLPRVITGAQPILPAGFTAYADLRQ